MACWWVVASFWLSVSGAQYRKSNDITTWTVVREKKKSRFILFSLSNDFSSTESAFSVYILALLLFFCVIYIFFSVSRSLLWKHKTKKGWRGTTNKKTEPLYSTRSGTKYRTSPATFVLFFLYFFFFSLFSRELIDWKYNLTFPNQKFGNLLVYCKLKRYLMPSTVYPNCKLK